MQFGGSGIFEDLFKCIRSLVPEGSTILELGSGAVSTQYLSRHYRMVSVEDNPEWVGRFNSTYIFAPQVNGWYDSDIVKSRLPLMYDAILVDGPTGEGNRFGFLTNLALFKTNVPIFFDDTNRSPEHQLAQQTADTLGRPIQFYARHAVIPA
jgi:hypothetical protein